jgi:HEAT repeat protein
MAVNLGSVAVDPNSPRRLEAEAAIQAIGTNAIPLLLKWIHAEQSSGSRRLHAAINKLPSTVGPSAFLYLHSLATPRDQKRALAAIVAFSVLRSQATPAVPELTRLVNDTNSPQTARYATIALAWIGTNALPSLVIALTSEDRGVRETAASAFHVITAPRGSTNLFPAVLQLLQKTDGPARERGTEALQQYAREVLQTNAPQER